MTTSWICPIGIIGTGAVIWLLLYLLYGTQRRSQDVPGYLREPPTGWKPCEVGYLCKWGQLDAQDMTAMIMDLVRRGVLRFVAPEATTTR